MTSGHGHNDGTIQTADGESFGPTNIKNLDVSDVLQTVIFENCYQGDYEKEWESSFENAVDVVGWNGPMNNTETVLFNTIGVYDRQDKKLSDYLNNITSNEKVSNLTYQKSDIKSD